MRDHFQLVATRQSELLELINANAAVDVNELSNLFGVSAATIRRDLAAMETRGLLARTHGGAVSISLANRKLPEETSATANIAEKNRIAAVASGMLMGHETVFLDAGTTAVQLAVALAKRQDCTFVTSSLSIANVFAAQKHPKFYLTGGNFLRVNEAFGGRLAANALGGLTFDIAYLCASAIDVDRRAISMVLEPYSETQRMALTVSRRVYVIADYTKFKSSAFSITASFDEIDGVITNRELDASMLAKCSKAGLEVILS